MTELRVERTIAASRERVFDWPANPANLTAASLILKAGWADGSSKPGIGGFRDVTAVGMWFREKITAYEPPRSYSYVIVRSFPATEHDGGTMTLTPRGDGTHVECVTT